MFPEINDGMSEMLFTSTFKPMLTSSPDSMLHMYLKEQAFRCWVLDFTQQDYSKIKFLEECYLELYKTNPQLCVGISNKLFSDLHDRRQIREGYASEWNSIRTKQENKEKYYTKWFDYYKSIFESEFSLWSSPFLAHILTNVDPNLQNQLPEPLRKISLSAEQYVKVPAWEKRKIIQDSSFPEVVEWIENRFRNAGSWHENWEVLDNWNCKYRIKDPKTFEVKEEKEINPEDFEKKVDAIERAVLIYEIAFYIFVNNHIQKLIETGPQVQKISEIGKAARMHAKEYQLELQNFHFPEDRSVLTLDILHEKKIISTGGKIYTDRSAHDVVRMSKNVKFIDNILQVIFYLMNMNWWIWFDVALKMTNEEDWITHELFFDKSEIENMKKSSHENKIYPKPKTWKLPENTYVLYQEIPVPYGFGKEVQKVLDNPAISEAYKIYTLSKLSGK